MKYYNNFKIFQNLFDEYVGSIFATKTDPDRSGFAAAPRETADPTSDPVGAGRERFLAVGILVVLDPVKQNLSRSCKIFQNLANLAGFSQLVFLPFFNEMSADFHA